MFLTRTREPNRTIDALRELAQKDGQPFEKWDLAMGWQKWVMRNNVIVHEKDGLTEPLAALKSVGGMPTGTPKTGWSVMECMHPFLGGYSGPPNPTMVQVLRHYAFTFAETGQRLVIVAPEGFTLPQELQHDLVVVDYDLPDKEELDGMLDAALAFAFKDPRQRASVFTAEQRETLVGNASGMTRLEAEGAFAEAVVRNRKHLSDPIPNLPFEQMNRVVMSAKTQVVKRSEVLELMPVGNMAEVAGLENLKSWVRRRKTCFTKAAEAAGVDRPRGCALIGPPGTGKSLSAKAIAHELGIQLIRFDVGRVFGSLIGQSEQRVRAALKHLEAMAPCVAFIDEVDKAGFDPRQGGGDSGVGKRVMGSILTFMQETTQPVFWLFTANRVSGMPPEMLRKGRLDEVFAVMPPTSAERMQVLRLHLAKRKQDPDKIKGLERVVAISEGYVPAEIEAAVKEAVVRVFADGIELTADILCEELQNMKPMKDAFPEDFAEMNAWAENNARHASEPETELAVVMVNPTQGGVRRRRGGNL